MSEIKPKTYNEIIRLKKCYTLASYYSSITEEMFSEMFEFLGQSENNSIVANQNIISFVDENGKVVKTYAVAAKNTSFDAININNKKISITPHYDPVSSSSYSSWGGSSGNNNNNNNNHNNNNNN